MTQKILTIITLLLISLNFVAADVVWTEHSDSTSVKFTIEKTTEQPHTKTKTFESGKPVFYSNWKCIDGRLQRTMTIGQTQKIQYGGICGLDLPATQRQTQINYFWTLPIIFGILILITLALTLVVVAKRL